MQTCVPITTLLLEGVFSSTENQIDHVCTTKKFRMSLQDVHARQGAALASDHHLLVAKGQLKLRGNWTGEKSQRLKFSKTFIGEPAIAEKFKSAPKSRFQTLQKIGG